MAMASEVQSFPVRGDEGEGARDWGDGRQAVSSGERALQTIGRAVCVSGSRTALLTWWSDLERVLENKSRARRRHAPNSCQLGLFFPRAPPRTPAGSDKTRYSLPGNHLYSTCNSVTVAQIPVLGIRASGSRPRTRSEWPRSACNSRSKASSSEGDARCGYRERVHCSQSVCWAPHFDNAAAGIRPPEQTQHSTGPTVAVSRLGTRLDRAASHGSRAGRASHRPHTKLMRTYPPNRPEQLQTRLI